MARGGRARRRMWQVEGWGWGARQGRTSVCKEGEASGRQDASRREIAVTTPNCPAVRKCEIPGEFRGGGSQGSGGGGGGQRGGGEWARAAGGGGGGGAGWCSGCPGCHRHWGTDFPGCGCGCGCGLWEPSPEPLSRMSPGRQRAPVPNSCSPPPLVPRCPRQPSSRDQMGR